jgi:hypothetical protein
VKRGAAALQHFARQEDRAARARFGERRENLGQAEGEPGDVARLRRAEVAPLAKDQRRQMEQRRRGLAAVGLEIGERRHRVVIEIERARLQQVLERR